MADSAFSGRLGLPCGRGPPIGPRPHCFPAHPPAAEFPHGTHSVTHCRAVAYVSSGALNATLRCRTHRIWYAYVFEDVYTVLHEWAGAPAHCPERRGSCAMPDRAGGGDPMAGSGGWRRRVNRMSTSAMVRACFRGRVYCAAWVGRGASTLSGATRERCDAR